MKKIFRSLFILVFLYSCSYKAKEVEETLYEMTRNEIDLDFNSLIQITGNTTNLLEYEYIWLIYIPSDYCKPCWVQELKEWEKYVKKYDRTNAISIISSKGKDYSEVKTFINNLNLNLPVYLDSTDVFKKKNNFIPEKISYHTFMIDKSKKIKIVGNPIKNEEIKELFEKNYIK